MPWSTAAAPTASRPGIFRAFPWAQIPAQICACAGCATCSAAAAGVYSVAFDSVLCRNCLSRLDSRDTFLYNGWDKLNPFPWQSLRMAPLLNKTTGCKSRTVPPLYMLVVRSFGESRSLGFSREGGASRGHPRGMSQKTYGKVTSPGCVITVRCFVAETRLRRLCGRRSNFVWEETT